MNSFETEKICDTEIFSCNAVDLTDLRNVKTDTSKPAKERIENFIEQVKNPYLFRVGDTVINAAYSGEKDISLLLAELIG